MSDFQATYTQPPLPIAAGISLTTGFECESDRLSGQGSMLDDSSLSTLRRFFTRAGYGWTPELALGSVRMSWDQVLTQQLNYESIDDSQLQERLDSFPTLKLQPNQLYPLGVESTIPELVGATIVRAVYSRRQLFERMVEFWTDHFNILIKKGECGVLKTIDDRDVMRTYALGNFRDLLKASAMSPAMIDYLDNRSNTKLGPNENYSRELLELHTLGDPGAFSQADVHEVARCFTGWSIVGQPTSPDRGRFVFLPESHDNGAKKVLGHSIPPGGGIQDGITLLEILAEHPKTVENVALKLGRFFYGENPPKSYLTSIAQSFRQSGLNIKSAVRSALAQSSIIKSPPMFRRPFHLFACQTRSILPQIEATQDYYRALEAVGHLPFHWGPPNGYPLPGPYWVGNMTSRWSFAMNLSANRLDGIPVPITSLVGDLTEPEAIFDAINSLVFAGHMTPHLRSLLRFYGGNWAAYNERTIRDLFGLTMSSPEYQYA